MFSVSELLGCVAAQWSPQIGDPNATGWLTVLAYLLCGALSLRVWMRLRDGAGRGFWAAIALLMLVLAVNKQLDLQTALTAAGKCLARAQGWYAHRRTVQAIFILALAGTVLIALLTGLRALRGRIRRDGIALTGMAILAGYVMIRAASFHHMDRLIGLRHGGVSVNFLFENAGLLLIALNAVAILRQPRLSATVAFSSDV